MLGGGATRRSVTCLTLPGASGRLDEIRGAGNKGGGGDGGDTEWPKEFFRHNGSVCYQPTVSSRDQEPTTIWVCADFEPVAETVDEQGSGWGLLLRWRDRDGCIQQRVVPRRLLHADGNQIAAELDNAGMTVGTGKQAHDLLKQTFGSDQS